MAQPDREDQDQKAHAKDGAGMVGEMCNLKSPRIQDVFSHILNVTVSCKSHRDIELVMNELETLGNTSFAHCPQAIQEGATNHGSACA